MGLCDSRFAYFGIKIKIYSIYNKINLEQFYRHFLKNMVLLAK